MIETKFRNKISPWLYFSFGVLALVVLFVLLVWKRIPPEIPWFYSMPWGDNQLMSKNGLPIILGIGAVVVYLSSLLAYWTKKGDKIIEQTIMVSLAFICLMLITNMAKVLFIFI